MTRKGCILTLLVLSWPINNLHRLWSNAPDNVGHWFPGNKEKATDFQWYVHDICESICYLLIILSAWLYITSHLKKDKDVTMMFGAILINQGLDLPHYLWSARHSEWMLVLQGVIMLYAAVKILSRRLE